MPAPHESFAATIPPTAPSGGVRVHIGVKIVGGALVGLAWLLFLSEFVRPKIVRVLLDNDWSGSGTPRHRVATGCGSGSPWRAARSCPWS